MTTHINELDPLSEDVNRDHIIHTTNQQTNADEKTTAGAVLDLLLASPASGDAITAANKLLTENDAGESATMTIQDVLDLVAQVTNIAPPQKVTPTQADLPTIVDAADDGLMKYISWAQLKEILALVTIGLDTDNTNKRGSFEVYTDLFGVNDEDKLQIRWGRYQSTDDNEEQFTFHTPFDNECHVCLVSVQGVVTRSALSQSLNPSETNFWIDRGDDINGVVPFHMVAIGR